MRTTAVLLILFMMAGCGQKGDLYLPSDQATETARGDQTQQEDEDDEKDDKDA